MPDSNLLTYTAGILGINTDTLQILGNAILGSSLWILFRAQEFLTTRSFDPRYNSSYFTRWVTGIISGVVLATTLRVGSGTAMEEFAPTLLALLGGFAAEAVELILKRFVEVLVTAVCGDSGKIVKTQLSAEQEKRNAGVLAKVAELNPAPGTPEAATVAEVKALLKQPPAGG